MGLFATIGSMAKNKVVLVTGGAGFIGSHVCRTLLDRGNSVVSVDNLATGNRSNIASLETNSSFQFVEGDIRNERFFADLTRFDISEIYDLASPASVDYISAHPVEAATVNSLGLHNILEFAKKGKAKILFASSSEVYGDPLEHPQKESYWGNVNPIGVRSGYDEGKRFGEALVAAYTREFGLETRIARIFNTYGPNSSPKDGRVVPRFVISALSESPLPVHGDGTQTRSFCFVKDLVDGLVRLMESSERSPVNLGNPEEVRILDVASLVLSLTGSSSRISFLPRPPDDPSRRMPDIAKAEKLLDWHPSVNLKDGLKDTIVYFRTLFSRQ